MPAACRLCFGCVLLVFSVVLKVAFPTGILPGFDRDCGADCLICICNCYAECQ